MKKTFNRRDFLRLSALGATGALVAACAPEVVEKIVKETVIVEGTPQVIEKVVVATAPPPATVNLVYMGQDESGAGEVAFKVYTDEVLAPFMEEYPHIKVELQPPLGDWKDALIASAAAGTAPDVFPQYSTFGRRLMESGTLLPLQDRIPQEDLDDFLEQQLIAMSIGPSLFALPRYVSSIALAYNKDLLDEAGVPYPDETWDWETFMDALHNLGDMGTSDRGKLHGFGHIHRFMRHYVWQNGGEWMNKDILGTKILIDQPKALEALEYLHDMIYKYQYAPEEAEFEGVKWHRRWQTGRFAFYEGHSWQVSDYVSTTDWNWDYAILPKGPVRRAGTVFNDAQPVYAKTKHPEEAVALLRWVSSPEVEKIMMLSVHGWQPSRKSLMEAWNTESAGAKAGKNVKAFSQILEHSRQDTFWVNHGEVADILTPLWERIWVTGDLGLEEGVKEICTRVNEYLATVV